MAGSSGTLELVVVRHGNTFGPGDRVTWVGRHEDVPLVAKGIAQATALGEALAREGWRPERVLASRLARTRGHAERALFVAGWSDLPVEVDPRLDELDYGPWGGLTTEEIEARGDGAALAAWSEHMRWPAAFGEREADARARVQGLAEELAAEAAAGPHVGARRQPRRVLLVSSNGVLRYLLALDARAFEARRAGQGFKLGTGRAGRLVYSAGAWTVLDWDVSPEALALPPSSAV